MSLLNKMCVEPVKVLVSVHILYHFKIITIMQR